MFKLLEKQELRIIPSNPKYKNKKYIIYLQKWECNKGIVYSINLNKIKLLKPPKDMELKIIKYELYNLISAGLLTKILDREKEVKFKNFKIMRRRIINENYQDNRYQSRLI